MVARAATCVTVNTEALTCGPCTVTVRLGAPLTNPAFALPFIAPPEVPVDFDRDYDDVDPAPARVHRAEPAAGTDGDGIRWLPKAKQVAQSQGISDQMVQDTMSSPERVGPDAKDPARTVFEGNGLMVVTGRDGVVLMVRRNRSGGR